MTSDTDTTVTDQVGSLPKVGEILRRRGRLCVGAALVGLLLGALVAASGGSRSTVVSSFPLPKGMESLASRNQAQALIGVFFPPPPVIPNADWVLRSLLQNLYDERTEGDKPAFPPLEATSVQVERGVLMVRTSASASPESAETLHRKMGEGYREALAQWDAYGDRFLDYLRRGKERLTQKQVITRDRIAYLEMRLREIVDQQESYQKRFQSRRGATRLGEEMSIVQQLARMKEDADFQIPSQLASLGNESLGVENSLAWVETFLAALEKERGVPLPPFTGPQVERTSSLLRLFFGAASGAVACAMLALCLLIILEFDRPLPRKP